MYKRIVVGTDGSPGALMAVDTAIQLAHMSGATLHVVNVHKKLSAFQLASAAEAGMLAVDVAETNDAILAGAQQICDQALERARKVGVEAESYCLSGDAADALMQVATDTGADLLVVGNRGMAGARRVLGSVPNKVSHHCPASLLIVDTSEARA